MPPALRELCEAVIVIGASFKYWFAALKIRCRSKLATLKVACWPATDQHSSSIKKKLIDGRFILLPGARAPASAQRAAGTLIFCLKESVMSDCFSRFALSAGEGARAPSKSLELFHNLCIHPIAMNVAVNIGPTLTRSSSGWLEPGHKSTTNSHTYR